MPLWVPLHNLAPPLQADQRQRRLTRDFPRSGQFMVERIQRQQCIPPVWGRKQGGQEPVGIMAANQSGHRVVHVWVVARLTGRCKTALWLDPDAGPRVDAPPGWP